MRRIRKALASLLLVCMLCPCISTVVNAASAELRFTDPSTTVGAEVEVTAKLTSSVNIQSLDATLTYDSSMLKFISGDNASGGDGTITLSGSGSGTSMDFILKFQALEEGTAKVEVSQASGKDSSGSSLQITNGSSAVTIGPGDPSLITEDEDTGTVSGDGPQVEVDGVQYVVSNDFSDAVIPSGFERSEMTFEGTTCQVVTQAASGESAMYLAPMDGGEADFFLYISDSGTFIPFEEVEIAQDRYLVLLRDDGSTKLPSQYQETTLTMNGKEFTAWQDTDNADYYMIYALNSDGEKALYRYDTVDKTYQRYEPQASADDTQTKSSPKGLWGKILRFIEDFLDIAVILGGLLLLILLIIIIVVAVKLRHRNLELDDLYDEYGIDLDEEEEEQAKGKKASKGKNTEKKASGKAKNEPAVRVPAKTANLRDEDDFDDYGDEDDFDEFEEVDYEDADYDDFDDEVDYEEEYGYDNDEPEDIIDDLDELLSSQPKKRGHMEPDDTFKVDFIDLDYYYTKGNAGRIPLRSLHLSENLIQYTLIMQKKYCFVQIQEQSKE